MCIGQAAHEFVMRCPSKADAHFLRRLPLASLIVLTGNVLRNSLLVSFEARPQGLSPLWHEAIGLATLAIVIALTVRVMSPMHRGGVRG